MKTILILGAGTGGMVVARELSKHCGNEDDISLWKILGFKKKETAVFSPSLTLGDDQPEEGSGDHGKYLEALCYGPEGHLRGGRSP